jgi:hypothetical protein
MLEEDLRQRRLAQADGRTSGPGGDASVAPAKRLKDLRLRCSPPGLPRWAWPPEPPIGNAPRFEVGQTASLWSNGFSMEGLTEGLAFCAPPNNTSHWFAWATCTTDTTRPALPLPAPFGTS